VSLPFDDALDDDVLDPVDASHADEAIDELSTEALISFARAAVRGYAFKKGVRFVGEDDMVQDTLAAALTNQHNSNGRTVLTRPYVRAIASGIVAQAARGRLRAEDRKAIGMFTKQLTDAETELDRNLTGTEQDELASRIRDEWPDPRHRPSVDFVALAQVRVLSLNVIAHNPDGRDQTRSLADTVSDSPAFSTDLNVDDMSVDPETPTGQVLSGARANRAQNRADGWGLYAGLAGLPLATPGHVRPRTATAARVSMADAGGVCAAARTWQHGETSVATEALFAPFAGLTDAARDDIADGLLGRAAYAEELWGAALSASSCRER